MENYQKSKTWPQKILGQLLETHFPIQSSYEGPQFKESDLYMVIGAKTGRPMCFLATLDDHGDLCSEDSLGRFLPAVWRLNGKRPAQIFDRETALALIGHNAISQSIYANDEIEEIGEEETKEEAEQEVLILVPVFGAMIPQCLTSNSTEK